MFSPVELVADLKVKNLFSFSAVRQNKGKFDAHH